MTDLILTKGTLKQSSFDKTGTGSRYDSIILNESYIVDSPLEIYSGTTITGSGTITLIDNASTSEFPSMTPVFSGDNVSDISISGVTFDGKDKYQTVHHGQGFHNLLGFTDSSNISITGITAGNSQGDIARITDSSDIVYSGNTIKRCGHDGLYVDRCSGVEAYQNTTYTRANSALRSKGSANVAFHDNTIFGTSEAYSPGIQVENSEANETTSGVSIYKNVIRNTLGPGIWAAGHTATDINAASGLLIRNNLICSCGLMPAGNAIPGVGGMVIDGWNDVLIQNNTIDFCRGYGILFGRYLTNSNSSGYKATVSRNIITNTLKNNIGTQGVGIANHGRYSVDISENCYYGNVDNGLTGSAPVVSDPHYGDNYVLMDDSPCILSDYVMGAYNASGSPLKFEVTWTQEDITNFIINLSQKNGTV